ncbi:hypothetical protein [Bacillus cereus]|uniref:hypothetical protein n=1 Tax=Bacillus cereus TaxID=1396 RepID=UPI000B4B2C21|nr:hypothetical protein [Bacillus cereus]
MNNWTKEDIIKKLKASYKVNEKKMNIFVAELSEITGLHNWIKNKTVIVKETSSYQDIEFFETFSLRLMKSDGEVLFFLETMGNMYNMLNSSKEFPDYIKAVERFIEGFSNVVPLKWNDTEVTKFKSVKWIANFHQRLLSEYDVMFNLGRMTFFIKDCNIEIRLKWVMARELQNVFESNEGFVIEYDNLGTDSVKDLEQLLEQSNMFEKLKGKALTEAFGSNFDYELINEELFNDRLGYGMYSAKPRVMKYIEKSVPGTLFETLFTLVCRAISVQQPYYSFKIDYYKCDAGYFFIDLTDKKVIYMETEDQMIAHCLESIQKQPKKILVQDVIRSNKH